MGPVNLAPQKIMAKDKKVEQGVKISNPQQEQADAAKKFFEDYNKLRSESGFQIAAQLGFGEKGEVVCTLVVERVPVQNPPKQ